MVAVKAIENPRSHATAGYPPAASMTPNFATTAPFVVSLSNHEQRDQRGRVKPRRTATIYVFGVWRSLVAHLHGVQGVVGSNPITPTI